jgi:hypothetical protein
MPVRRDVEWDALDHQRPDALVESKRTLELLDSQRVGADPGWKLRVAMLREAREEHNSEVARKRAEDPEYRRAVSEGLKSAWARGAFAQRKQAYRKRTDHKVRVAKQLKADGLTYAQIGEALDVTPYTVARWLGWERTGIDGRRMPITVDGVTYESLRSAERNTGVSRWELTKLLRKGTEA